jgi:hypothetical protein
MAFSWAILDYVARARKKFGPSLPQIFFLKVKKDVIFKKMFFSNTPPFGFSNIRKRRDFQKNVFFKYSPLWFQQNTKKDVIFKKKVFFQILPPLVFYSEQHSPLRLRSL